MRPLVEPHIERLIPYIPGKPIEETEREYGVTDIAKLASNENCLGPSPKAVEAIRAAATDGHLYPDADAFYLKQRICERHADHGVKPEQLVVGNGTNEVLVLLVRAFVGEGEAVLNAWPSFVVYKLAAAGQNRHEVNVPLDDELGYDLDAMADAIDANKDGEHPIKLVFVANPNNPTGRHIGQGDLERFLARVPDDVIVVLDEAYAEYATADDYPDGLALAAKRPRTVVTRTFSKAFGLAALRVGYAVCDPDMADAMNRLRDPFNVNAIGQLAARAALDDNEHVARAKAHNAAELPRLSEGLSKLGMKVTPSQANFVLAELPEGSLDMGEVYEALLKKAVIIRPVKGYGLPRSARITVGTVEENDRLVEALGAVLAGGAV
jgi:histidinol-phosphate aminotransferase